MTRKRADSSASDVSASGHSDNNNNNNKSKTIATGAAKVFNKIILKSRPSAIKSPAEEASARFQIVHTPDRSPVEMPLSGFPTTNEEFDAAISRINLRSQPQGGNASFEQKGFNKGSRRGTPRSPHSVRFHILRKNMGMADTEENSSVARTAVTCPGSSTVVLGPRGNGPLDKPRGGFDAPEPTLSATSIGKARPTYVRRVASDGVPPRPLSERPLIYSSKRARPSLQTPYSSISTPNAHSVFPVLRRNASVRKDGHFRPNSGEKNSHRRPRRPPSPDSSVASSAGDTDSDDKTSRHRVSSARFTRDPQQKIENSQTMRNYAAGVPKKSTCYFCQEDCQPEDNLCSKCQTRFQPQEEVFDYSESEYEDDIELDDDSHFSPETERPPITLSRSSKRRTTRYPRPREKSRGWSDFSSVSQLQQLASRSASTSPTSHVALELKVVPPQEIKIRTVSSPIKANAGDSRSALHHIQQAMKPRGPVGPSSQDRDSIRLGRVRSGEIRRVDIPDIIKAKAPTPEEKSSQSSSQEHHHQSRGSLRNWLKYYNEDDRNSETHSARSNFADLPTSNENSAGPATPGAYDRVTSIYDLYASFEDA